MIHRSKKLRIRPISLNNIDLIKRKQTIEMYKKKLVKEIIDEMPIEYLESMFSITMDEGIDVIEIKGEILCDSYIRNVSPEVVNNNCISPEK